MPELADSYCERCGARYAFNPNASKAISLKGARVLAKGLKNFVLTDGQSMSDSIALARNEDDHQDSSKVTEAFHKTFNFCMTCRQYACDRCWNAKVGACLSCSPEDGVLPNAPQEHLIVRTPVAEWDSDWSLFPDGPAAEPVASPPPPTRFNEPIVLPEPAPLAQASPAAAPAWPVSDLPAGQPAAGSNGKNGHRTSHKQADQAAASLWPIADEIAPEMTLTAEELELVESSLQGDPIAELEVALEAEPSAIPEPQIYDAQPMWIRQEEPAPEAPSPTGWGASWRTSSPSPWDTRTAATGNGAPDTRPDLVEGEPLPPMSQPAALAAEPQPKPERILSMPIPSGTPAVPSPAPKAPQAAPEPEPQAAAHEHTPIVSRLLSHIPLGDEVDAAVARRTSRRGRVAGDPWPHVTAWADRPVKTQDWDNQDDRPSPAPAVPSPEPAVPEMAPPPQPFPTPALGMDYAPMAAAHQNDGVDARGAAAVRLSAVTVGQQPVDPAQPALFDIPIAAQSNPPAPTAPARPEADQDVIEATKRQPAQTKRSQTRDVSASGPAPVPAPAAQPAPPAAQPAPVAAEPLPASPWPPLGASWPAQADPNAPWPGPDTNLVPAVVAAQAAPAPVLTDMWLQSSQEVLNRGAVRVCHRCALPVSTQARFCRRCGTRQI